MVNVPILEDRNKKRKKYLTIKKIARMLNVSPKRVKTMAKWYAVKHGKDLEDYAIALGPRTIVYDMPPDFIEFARKELKKEGLL